jgi:uncharacterized membrane protein YjfL (UPF0719 family)
MFSSLLLWATIPPQLMPWNWDVLLWHITQVVIYVVLGLGLFALAYLIVQKVVPFSIRKEIEEDQNIALGVVLGSVFIGIAIILAAAIRG